jgi:predicted nicotinamide N-methyase
MIQLGAGMGLCGILASHLGAATVVLTDGDTDALAQLRRNVHANCCGGARADTDDEDDTNNDATTTATSIKRLHDSNNNVTCRQLVWGRNLDHFVAEHGFFDVVLGSDIIYVPEIIEPLFETIERIMKNPRNQDDGDQDDQNYEDDAMFILAYARRNVPIDLVLDHAKQRGFVWTCPESAEGVFCFKRGTPTTRREG